MIERFNQWRVKWKRLWLYRRCLAGPCPTVILRYHSVGDPILVGEYTDPGLSLSAERFREHLRLLKQRFRFVSLDEVLWRLERDRAEGPAAALTFDDGYRDNHDVALPILLEEGAKATFFVTSGPLWGVRPFWISELRRLILRLPAGPISVPALGDILVPEDPADRFPVRRRLTRRLSAMSAERRDVALETIARASGAQRGEGLEESFLDAERLRAMRRAGMEIGGHTRTHPHLDRVDPEELDAEIVGGKRDLEAVLGEELRHFAYPNPGGGGRNEDRVRAALRRGGFRSAVTSVPGPLMPGADPFALPRLGVYAGEQEISLLRILCG